MFSPCNNPTHGCFKFLDLTIFHSAGILPSPGKSSMVLFGYLLFTSVCKYVEIGKINDEFLKQFSFNFIFFSIAIF